VGGVAGFAAKMLKNLANLLRAGSNLWRECCTGVQRAPSVEVRRQRFSEVFCWYLRTLSFGSLLKDKAI